MIEQIEALIRENAKDLVIDNPQVPNEHNEEVIQAASNSVIEGLKGQLNTDNINGLIQSFTQGDSSSAVNTLIKDVQSNFTEKLGTLGLSERTIKSLAASLIPLIISKFMGQNSRKRGLNIQDILKNFADKDGKLAIGDVIGIFDNDDAKGKKKQGGSGLLDQLKDLF